MAGDISRALPALVGETAGRVRVPLPGLPPGLHAYTVPKPLSQLGSGGDRVPRDNRGRVKPTRVDLLPAHPVDDLVLPDVLGDRDMLWILGTGSGRLWSTMVDRFGDDALAIAADLVRAGIGVIRCKVVDFDHRPRRFLLTEAWAEIAPDRITELTGIDVPTVRAELIALMARVPALHDERDRLAAITDEEKLRVPAGTRSRTRAWSVYEVAIRAAALWIPDHAAGIRHTAKSLAAKSLNDSKRWTLERQTAFANLVGVPFTQAVDETDTEVLLRGPLVWRMGGVIADASASRPWIGLPTAGLRLAGTVDLQAVHGVLLVENKDAFQKVCELDDVVTEWLCVWGEGYTSRGMIGLLSRFADRPVVAWCDLDADGIQIVTDLSRKLDRTVRSVGMTTALWRAGPYRRQDEDQLRRGRDLAGRLAATGPADLRDLAATIAPSGDGREQETMYEDFLPNLSQALDMVR